MLFIIFFYDSPPPTSSGGSGSVSPVLCVDYPGGISGDVESTVHKIMIKVLMNLIREEITLGDAPTE